MTDLLRISFLLTLAALTGCDSDPPLLSGTSIERMATSGRLTLHSLDPYPPAETASSTRFREWTELGQVNIENDEERREILSSLAAAFDPEVEAMPAACFDPRHAVHWTHGDEVVDIVVCYECGWIWRYDGETPRSFAIHEISSETLLDGTLTAAQIPLAPKHR